MKITKNRLSMFLTLKYGENIKRENILYHREPCYKVYYLHSIFIRDVGVYEKICESKSPYNGDWKFFPKKDELQRLFIGNISKRFLQNFVEIANIYVFLSFYRTNIKDISIFTKLSYLEELWLIGNKISNIEGIKNMTHLKLIDLRENQIPLKDIKELSYCLPQLKIVSDYGPYKNMKKLE